jgi:hypothetical protein
MAQGTLAAAVQAAVAKTCALAAPPDGSTPDATSTIVGGASAPWAVPLSCAA